MINYLFNIVGLVYIIGVKGFMPTLPVKPSVWLHIRYLRIDRSIIDKVDYLKYHALLDAIWAPINTLYR